MSSYLSKLQKDLENIINFDSKRTEVLIAGVSGAAGFLTSISLTRSLPSIGNSSVSTILSTIIIVFAIHLAISYTLTKTNWLE